MKNLFNLLGVSFNKIKLLNKKIAKLSLEIFRLTNVLDSIPGGIYWKNKEGIYLGRNKYAAEMMVKIKLENSYCKDYVIGKTDYDLFPEETADEYRKHDAKVIASNKELITEETLNFNNGDKLTQLSIKKPLYDKSGEVVGVIGNTMDITYRKRIEQKLILAKKQVEEEMKAKEKLLKEKIKTAELISNSIAHELRTPLKSVLASSKGLLKFLPRLIKGYKLAREAELAADDIQSRHLENIETGLNHIEEESQFANTIIDMLLVKSTRNLAGKIDLSEYSISECIEEALERYPFIPAEQRQLVHWNNGGDFNVTGSKSLIIHVIFNLIKNALYYVEKAGKGDISIWLSNHNELHFKDTGTGINSEDLPKIFEPFFSKTHEGTGVGLAFCKMVMKNMSGKIKCHSKEGQFAEFTLTFPKDKKLR